MRVPSRQELIAENWPLRLFLGVTTAGTAIAIGWFYLGTSGVPAVPWQWVSFAGYLAAAGALGFFAGGLLSWFILGPIYYGQGIENGAPYEPGDRVRILAGPHRDRVVAVYKVWSERNQVRVELGEAEREAVTDVFSYVQVCRQSPAVSSDDPVFVARS